MAITKSTNLTNSAVTNYKKEAMSFAWGEEIWGQFVDWDEPIPDDGGNAASFDYLAFGELDPAITALTEDADVTPQSLADYNVTVTPAEYGNAVGRTQKLAFVSRVKTQERFAEIVGKNRTRSIDRLIRNGIMAGSLVRYAGAATSRATLDATADLPTYDWLIGLVATAQDLGMEPLDSSGNYAAVVHPMVAREIMKLTEWKSPRYYMGSDIGGDLYKGEVGLLGNVRFISNRWGKVFLSGGTAPQAATTLSSAIAAGATTVPVAEQSGLVAGDFITIGTLESGTAEQVMVTAAAGASGAGNLTVQGVGQGPAGFGVRFAHASGEAVTEAANVGAIPLIGKNSIKGVYGARTGKYGEYIVKDGLDLLNRFVYFAWYWFGGIGRVERYILRGECAITGGLLGFN